MKKIASVLLTLTVALPLFAQGKFGKDSAECVKFLSYYSELVKQNNLEAAAESWRGAISVCPPTANQNMFINGQKIIRYEIKKNAKDPKRVAELVDTLLMLHDRRAENYPKYAAKSLDNKAMDILTYLGKDNEKVFNSLSEIIGIIKTSASPVVFVREMQAAVAQYKDGKLSADDLMANYDLLNAILEERIAAGNGGEYAGAKQDFETVFIESGVASCENLVALYTPRYQANPTDKDMLSSMVKMLAKSECMNTDLFLQAVESLHSVDPSANSAYYLYKLYSSRDENAKAAESLTNAISLLTEDEAETKADYDLELATFYFKKLGRAASAVEKAKEAVSLNEKLAGKAYLLIGTIWGSQKCGGNEVESRAAFWVAVDYLQKAKNADPSLEEEAGNLAAQYRKYFPQQADAFMYDLIDGQSYSVNCNGMHESTIIRTIK